MYTYVFIVQNVIVLPYLCKYTHELLFCISVFYSVFAFPDDEKRGRMVVEMFKEKNNFFFLKLIF